MERERGGRMVGGEQERTRKLARPPHLSFESVFIFS